jgi:hypothetical protein
MSDTPPLAWGLPPYMGAPPPVSPLTMCQNVSFGGIIPYVMQNNFWEKNDLFWGIYDYGCWSIHKEVELIFIIK